MPPFSYPFPFAKVVGRKYAPGPGASLLTYNDVMLLPFFILCRGALPSLDADGMKVLGAYIFSYFSGAY